MKKLLRNSTLHGHCGVNPVLKAHYVHRVCSGLCATYAPSTVSSKANFTRCLVIVLLLFFILIKSSQAVAECRYVVLDMDKIISSSSAFVNFKNEWDRVSDAYSKEIQQYEAKMVQLDAKAESVKSKNEKAFLDLKRELGEYEIKVQKLVSNRRMILDAAMGRAIETIKTHIDNIVKEYAVAHNINLILLASQIAYFSSEVDITDPIILSLNKRIAKLDIAIK